MNTTQTVTQTQPTETVLLLQPALAITVTLPQPAPPGQLNIQVLPAYEPGGRKAPMNAAWAAAAVLDATNPLTYTQVISLESRIASGFVRVWISDTVGIAWFVSRSPSSTLTGTGARNPSPDYAGDSRGGLGGDSRGGLGGDSRGGLGSHSLAGMAGDSRGGLGGDSRGGLGGDSRGGLGADSRGGLGGDSRGGLGGHSLAGLGGDSRGGLGGDSRGGLGGDSRGGLGGDSRGGLGGDSRGGLGGDSRGGLGGDSRGGLGADALAWGANRTALEAPVASSDGQATIYNREDALADTATGTLQALAAIPTVPEWLTPVGQAYRFVATRPLPRTIGFNYLQREVPPGYEHTLQLYYSPDEGNTWRRLPTELDVNENLATAPADKSGLYMLAASIDIPFTQPDGICSPIRCRRHGRSAKRWHPSMGTTARSSPTITAIRRTRGRSSMPTCRTGSTI